MELKYFSIGQPKQIELSGGKEMVSGIMKEMTEEAFLSKDGFIGDGVADLKHHGGPDRAVCIYPFEHYALWEEEFNCHLSPATFGENLTVSGMLEKDVRIGDVFRIGEALIQVTQSRIPCSTITKRTGLPLILKRIVETGYTGYLCRVLDEGTVRHNSRIELVTAHVAGISVMETNELYFRNPKDEIAVQRVLSLDELADKWRHDFAKRSGVAINK